MIRMSVCGRFEANFGQQLVTLAFHAVGAGPGGPGGPRGVGPGGPGGARLLRRGSRMDVLV